jgi:hypothetical protein
MITILAAPANLACRLLALPLLLAPVACTDPAPILAADAPAMETPAGAATAVLARHGPPATTEPIVVSGGFALPESMVHDPVADVYLVSNIGAGENPLALDGDGFISRIAPDGTVLDWRWIDGADPDVTLHGPFGLMIDDDVLYVVDRDALRAFDRATGAPLGVVHAFPYTLPHSEGNVAMLNAVCRGPDGAFYVTDTGLTLDATGNFVPTGTDAVYRIADGQATAVAAGDATEGPNGCFTLGGSVAWTTFKSNRVLRTNPSGGILEVGSLPAGQIDSAVRVGGFLYLSSWEASAIFRMTLGGSNPVQVWSDLPTPGDLGFDALRQRLLVPLVFANEIRIIPM